MDDGSASDRSCVPSFESPLAGGGRANEPTAAKTGRSMDGTGREAAFLQPLQGGINRAGAVAERPQGSPGKKFPKVIAGARLPLKQAESGEGEEATGIQGQGRFKTAGTSAG